SGVRRPGRRRVAGGVSAADALLRRPRHGLHHDRARTDAEVRAPARGSHLLRSRRGHPSHRQRGARSWGLVPLGGAVLEPASFSSMALATKSITDVSASTQWSLSLRCSARGIRVASCTHTTPSVLATVTLPFGPQSSEPTSS